MELLTHSRIKIKIFQLSVVCHFASIVIAGGGLLFARRSRGRRLNQALIAVLSLAILYGCTNSLEVRREASETLQSAIITGYIHVDFACAGPLVVGAYTQEGGVQKVEDYMQLQTPGEFELMVKAGHYRIFAYYDRNKDFVYDRGEPAGQYGSLKEIFVSSGGVLVDISIVIRAKGDRIELPYGVSISQPYSSTQYHRTAGIRKSLDDNFFSEEFGSKGFWAPHKFYREVGANIYFIEKYDPDKIPILFIHGATGTPKGWKYFVDNIDRTRFQPWFFYYPSGARLKSTAYLLFWKLFNLQLKYKFSHIYITAHSMGGLIARSFIIDYGSYFNGLDLFVSLATPWSGDVMADYGVRQSPVIVPSWIDMRWRSKFIESVYQEKMPEKLDFYMFYGYCGSRNGFNTNNDGTVTFDSLLDLRPQLEARRCIAFNEDHSSILSSRNVIEQYNKIINASEKKDNQLSKFSGGKLKIELSYHDFSAQILPWPTLRLQPKRKNCPAVVLYLKNSDSKRLLGPFPSGDYYASLMVKGARIETEKRIITITPRQTAGLNFNIFDQKEDAQSRLMGPAFYEKISEPKRLEAFGVNTKKIENSCRIYNCNPEELDGQGETSYAQEPNALYNFFLWVTRKYEKLF